MTRRLNMRTGDTAIEWNLWFDTQWPPWIMLYLENWRRRHFRNRKIPQRKRGYRWVRDERND